MPDERPAPKAKNDLRIGAVDWISLCASPDNPEAQIILAKTDVDWNPEVSSQGSNVGSMSDTNPTQGTPAVDIDKVIAAVGVLMEQNEELRKQNSILAKHLEETLDDEDYEDDDEGEEIDEVDEEIEDSDGDEIDDDDADDDGDVEKFLTTNPALAELFAAQQTQIAELRKANDRAENIAKQEREARLTVEFSKRAEALGALGESDEAFAKDLRDLFDVLPVAKYHAWEVRFAKWAEQLNEGGLFDEYGTDGSDENVSKLDELLAKTAAGANGSGLTPEQAFVEHLRNNPDDYVRLEGRR